MKKRPKPARPVPGLTTDPARGLVWRDCLGRDHVLISCKRLTIGEVAARLRCDEGTVRNRINSGLLYPVFRHNARAIEVAEPAVDDFLARSVVGRTTP